MYVLYAGSLGLMEPTSIWLLPMYTKLIEYLKEPHFSPEEYLKELKAVDEAKREQCEKQGILLFEITESMTKEDILSLIKKFLPIR